EEEEELQTKSLDSSTLQRESLPEEEEEELQKSPMVQRQAKAGMAANSDLETSIDQARGSGQPMGDNIRQPMEQAFGADFSGVKVHTDAQSNELNQSIQARAFTTGQDVFFRQGEYNPGSRGGQELLAHELTHVVQQNGGAVQRIQPQAIGQNYKYAKQVQMQTLADAQGLVVQTVPDLILQLTQWTSRNLTNHFIKHSGDSNFAYTNQTDYEQAAINFVDSPSASTQLKNLSDGSTVYYDPNTDDFASVAPNGNIKTFFQPGRGNSSQGQRYFNRLT
ncbi:MAG: DUF4157 domain-containing protein, partial [Nostoc sp. S4]|nr:DUF4157 domain-containing protein [Nostoc sp. S4]